MNKKLSRRDFLKLAGVTSAGLALSACGVKATELPTATFVPPTETIIPTVTSVPTSTPPLPLEQLSQTKQALAEFVHAFQTAEMNISIDQLIQKGLKIHTVTGRDKKQCEIALVYIENPDGLGEDYPLMIKIEGDWEEVTIKNMVEKVNFDIGCVVGHTYVIGMKETLTREFTLGELAYDINWNNITPQQGDNLFRNPERYSDGDSVVNLLLENRMNIRGHDLLFAQFYPDWIKNSNFSAKQLEQIVMEHINSVMSHYKGRVSQWVVLNELHPTNWGRDDIIQRIVGRDRLVELAFQTARNADPKAALIYNDINNHILGSPESTITQRVVDTLIPKGLIDGVGMQMHIDGSSPPSKKDVIRAMQSYGTQIYVTEFDVNMSLVSGSSQKKAEKQAKIYKDMLLACFESGVCKSFSIYGIGDNYSWLEPNGGGNSPNADPTPFDDNLQPKQAYYAMIQAIYEILQTH